MIYVFDTSSLVSLFRNYFPDRFPSLWLKYNNLISLNIILSVRETLNEINMHQTDRLSNWAKNNMIFFTKPSKEELDFVNEIFSHQRFQDLIRRQERLQGKPVADPFIIAKAKIYVASVVTEELYKENAISIPNVCEYYKIPFMNLEGFMINENWVF
jgi:hypothetical protein